jgi:hypothetical protein
MLHDVNDMFGVPIEATDGALGHIRDFYFDDEVWVIRYLIVETGNWLSNRRVLVSPMAMDESNWTSKRLPVRLTREQVRECPSIDTDKPVSRQHELQFAGYYGYPNYWGGGGLWGEGSYPAAMLTGVGYGSSGSGQLAAQARRERLTSAADQRKEGDPHLRSCNAIAEYHIHAVDGEIGRVQSMLVDEESWAIRYLIVNTSYWWLGHQVLIAPEWITDLSWIERKVTIDLTCQAIKESPHWDPALLPDRSQESQVYQHYGRKGYWQFETPASITPRIADSDRGAHSETVKA